MKTFKKIVITLFVIESFIAYIYYNKVHKHEQIAQPKGLVNVTSKISTKPTVPSAKTIVISPTTTEVQSNSPYKNGQYTGSVTDAFYGNIQVQITISSGKMTHVTFLQSPHDQDTSVQINQEYDPVMAQEAIQAQSAQVNIVSGATQSSQAFIQSLQDALQKAKS